MRNKRKFYIDNLRGLACLLVVLDHVVIVGYRFLYSEFLTYFTYAPLYSKLLSTILWEISRFGVPMFCMISGALILDKDFSTSDNIRKFYRNNVLPLLVINYIWIIIYWVISYLYTLWGFDYVYNGSEWNFSLKEFLYQLFLIHRGNYANIWFVPMILGMYIFLPLVAESIKSFYKLFPEYIFIPLIISVVILFLFTDLNNLFGLTYPWDMKSIVFVDFSGGVYGIYIIIGWLLSKIKIKKVRVTMIATAGVFIISTIFMIMSYHIGRPVNNFIGNDSFCQLSILSGIFLIFRACLNKESQIMRWLAKYSFPIYLFHWPIVHLLNHVIIRNNIGRVGSMYTLMLFFLTVAICCIISMLIPDNSFLKKYVFHVK